MEGCKRICNRKMFKKTLSRVSIACDNILVTILQQLVHAINKNGVQKL